MYLTKMSWTSYDGKEQCLGEPWFYITPNSSRFPISRKKSDVKLAKIFGRCHAARQHVAVAGSPANEKAINELIFLFAFHCACDWPRLMTIGLGTKKIETLLKRYYFQTLDPTFGRAKPVLQSWSFISGDL
ncbi:unnamed protein product [Phytophthora fragariaefolia]|uniref:Unnamed protein product n=1 Tax=Phytophthora fragariaefolia TaxID=1490495 RepID=A0A9W6XRW8_9STRA|nr:unnamed protein product [Phytophthora fragariaefolia]